MTIRRVLIAAALAFGLQLVSGCGGGSEQQQSKTDPGVTGVDYTTRGVVAQLPIPAEPGTEFFVRHEAIPDFRASLPDGALGMNAMTMPFPIAEDVSLDGLEIGDKITLTFRVDYDAKTGAIKQYRATSFSELPADTVLTLSEPKP